MFYQVVRFPPKASQWGAFCFYGVLVFLGLSVPAVAEESSCRAERHDERVVVRHVLDGDTVILTDGRHVRLIGINAPERASKRRTAQPYSERARSRLHALTDQEEGAVLLSYGAERNDRYGRTLAHLFLLDGSHLGADLLRDGLAAAIAVPPNLGFQKCLRASEQRAREQGIGIWREARYAGKKVSELADITGFVRVRGNLDGTGFSKDALWLQVDGRLGLRIHKSNLRYFRRWNFHALRGKEVIVRGWLTRRKGKLRMELKHPHDLEIVEH